MNAVVSLMGSATEAKPGEHSPRTEQRPPLILHPAALHGLAGEVVALATRNSEAAPAAVLLTLLARFGCEAFNPHTQAPYLSIGETRHSARLFVAVCGQTAKARKGTSAKPVERFFAFPPGFACRPQESPGPLSSGEGLIYAVRDTRESGESEQESGTTDRRLFVLDEELAAALKARRGMFSRHGRHSFCRNHRPRNCVPGKQKNADL